MAHRRAGSGPAIRQATGSGVAELIADPDRPRAWTLLVDGKPQSHVDLDDPGRLEFEYMRLLGDVADLAAPPGQPVRALHLGAGGLTLARYVAATRPGSTQLAAESDAGLADLVRQHLPLSQRSRRSAGGEPGRIRVRTADARALLEQVPAGSFDLIVADVFAGGRTPAHLTSVQFTTALARALAPAGLCAINVTDGPPLAHARSRVATVGSVFPHAGLIADPAVLRGRRFGNLILAGSLAPLPAARLAQRAAAHPFPARLIDGRDLTRFTAGARAITDASAAGGGP